MKNIPMMKWINVLLCKAESKKIRKNYKLPNKIKISKKVLKRKRK